MGWLSVGASHRVMAMWNLVHFWECVMLPVLLFRVISTFLPCYHTSLLLVLDVLVLIFAHGEDLTLKTCQYRELENHSVKAMWVIMKVDWMFSKNKFILLQVPSWVNPMNQAELPTYIVYSWPSLCVGACLCTDLYLAYVKEMVPLWSQSST